MKQDFFTKCVLLISDMCAKKAWRFPLMLVIGFSMHRQNVHELRYCLIMSLLSLSLCHCPVLSLALTIPIVLNMMFAWLRLVSRSGVHPAA